MTDATAGPRADDILDGLPDAVIVLDGAGRIAYLNAAALAHFAPPRARHELIGQDFWQTFARPAGSSLEQECRSAVAANVPVDLAEHDPASGRWLRVRAAPSAEGLRLCVTDVTETKRVEERLLDANAALLESEQRFRFLTDVIPPQVWTARPDGALDFVNRRVVSYFGRSAEQIVGEGWQQVVHPDDLPEVSRCWSHSLRTGERYEVEFRLRRADGAWRWHIARADPLRDGRGRITKWFGTNSDVDDLKAADESLRQYSAGLEQRVRERTAELQATNEKLRVSNRELEDFASVASHDLQEPLRKIRAFGDRLAQRAAPALGPEGQDYLRRMQAAAARMAALINDLLSFSRITTRAQPFAPVDLGRIAEEVMSDLETTLQQSGGRVEVGPLPSVEADPTQMRQLLQNLIGNALKFAKSGVPPVVRVGSTDASDNGDRDRDDDSVELFVADEGIGFDEKYLDRIFDVFQRLHGRGAYEGNGIGLAVCRKIVERHGGTITARSRPGEGATFLVTLPRRQHRCPAAANAVPAEVPAAAAADDDDEGGVLDATAAARA